MSDKQSTEIIDTLKHGGRVVVRKRKTSRGLTLDTELCSRHIGLMAIAKAEASGEIRVKNTVTIPKGVMVEYELVEESHV